MARRQSSDGEAGARSPGHDEKVDDAREALQAAERASGFRGKRVAAANLVSSRSSARATGRSTTRPTPATTRSWRCC